MNTNLVALSELMLKGGGSVNPAKFSDEMFELYSIPAFDVQRPEVTLGAFIGSSKQIVQKGDVLLSKIVPHIRRSWVVGKNKGYRTIASGEWIIFRSDKVVGDYLRHVLVGDPFHNKFMQTVSGVGGSLLRARPAFVADICIPLPSLTEQKRIAAILDKADLLRVKRRTVIKQLDVLAQAMFSEMFGDLHTNSCDWSRKVFRDVLSIPLRNGLSPSTSGKIEAKVLTLSAITGPDFESGQWRLASFNVIPPANQAVDVADFLICRGNGNRHLVGGGHFPDFSMSDVTFPDTMIAARVDMNMMSPLFLEFLWKSPFVRKQIDKAVRTTNGAFKVNQTILEGINIVCPPVTLQRLFSEKISFILSLKMKCRNHLAQLDAVFNSLQDRAFRGEL